MGDCAKFRLGPVEIHDKLAGEQRRLEKGEGIMDAIIGRYRIRIEDAGTLVLQHPTGIMFDLTADEALALMDFIAVYRKALMALERDTDAEMERVVIRDTAGRKEPQAELHVDQE